jgi:uncharacterized protein YndB with AHSA1/START domain
MMTEQAQQAIQVLDFHEQRLIEAPIDIVFQTVLEPQGPLAEMKLKLEAFPGGRWFRDLGNNTGHLWGHVQVIKPPKLLEITGPMMMSYPVASFIQYKLTEQGSSTLLQFTHQAIGLITQQHMEGVRKGWNQMLDETRARAEKASK